MARFSVRLYAPLYRGRHCRDDLSVRAAIIVASCDEAVVTIERVKFVEHFSCRDLAVDVF